MTRKKGFVERRRHKRFKIKESAFAEFHKCRLFKVGKPRLAKSAPIIDISLGGLGFQYASQDMWPVNFETLTISKASDEIGISNVPFKAVSDFCTSILPDSKSMRRCGVKFCELSSEQKTDLHAFIQHHIISDQPIDRRTSSDRRNLDALQYNGSERRTESERRK